jgi:phosphatidylglycerophosphate synthase
MNVQPLRDTAKSGEWFLRNAEDKLRSILVPFVPPWLQTYHLTLMSLVWSFGVVVAGYLAQIHLEWLWLSSLMILCQYITDLLDGTIGRLRNTGLVKWGYFMDHFLDYVFFTSLILSYSYLFPDSSLIVLIFLAFIQIGFMINIFLYAAAAKVFDISFIGFGPTEVRILYILFNTFIIFFGLSLPVDLMPHVSIILAAGLVLNVYFTQKKVWHIDMDIKRVADHTIVHSVKPIEKQP